MFHGAADRAAPALVLVENAPGGGGAGPPRAPYLSGKG
ncbi:hypothetical protein C357_20647, partial [Citreicella sp. 357]